MTYELTPEDHQAIDRTLGLAGHIVDRGELDRLDETFTSDAVYDLSDVGAGTFEGIEAIRNGALELGAGNPVAHHITNIVISGQEEDAVTAQSGNAATLSAIQSELAEIKARMASVETILKAVE